MILDNSVIMKWCNFNKDYYIKLGYIFTGMQTQFSVKIEDLPNNSEKLIRCKCDYCNKIFFKKYSHIIKSKQYVNKDNCNECFKLKRKETNLIKYGVENPSQNIIIKQKIEQTCIKKFGCKKALQSKVIQSKVKQTCLNKYGTEYAMQNKNIIQKMEKTNLQKYGNKCSLRNKKVASKVRNQLYNNGTQKSSKQQRHLNDLFQTELNYPFNYYSLDMADVENKIDIEYDGGGHELSVKHGNITEKEFLQKEIIRNNYIYKHGWKIIRIQSSTDKLLSDEKMIKIYNRCKDYLLSTRHHWIIVNLDSGKIISTVLNISLENFYNI